MELKIAEQPVSSVDLSRDNKLMVAGSKDGNAYIADMAQGGKVIQKLSFRPAPNLRNMKMQSCLFARDGSIYTMAIYPQQPTYVIRWQCNRRENQPKAPPTWTPALTKEVHHKPSKGMRASRMGQICVMTSDGFVSLLDAMNLQETTPIRKVHNMPISNVCFRDDEGVMITSGIDYKYCIIP